MPTNCCLIVISNHLNPDEQVWAHAKRQVSRRLVQNHYEMNMLGNDITFQKFSNIKPASEVVAE